MDLITSAKNPAIRALRALRERAGRLESRRILVEGEVMLREALQCGLPIHELIADEKHISLALEMEKRGARAYQVPRSLLESVCDTKTPQGVCASFDSPLATPIDALPDIVVALDGVQDPGNLGTI